MARLGGVGRSLYQHGERGPTNTVRLLEASPAAPGEARSFVASTLRDWNCEGLVQTAILLVSELVTNAVMHAKAPTGSDVELRMAVLPDTIRVEVVDHGHGTPVRQDFNPKSLAGRGLGLVDAMASTWGVQARPRGKVVWFELEKT